MEIVELEHRKLLPQVLEAMYPDKSERENIIHKLSEYGKESYQVEKERVHMGILYLTSKSPETIDENISLACCDFRDLLVAAEYPLSFGKDKLKEKNPEKYRSLELKEQEQYYEWLESLKIA